MKLSSQNIFFISMVARNFNEKLFRDANRISLPAKDAKRSHHQTGISDCEHLLQL